MKIGKLFQFKKYFWLLYPSKDIAVAVGAAIAAADTDTAALGTAALPLSGPATTRTALADAADRAAYLSNRFKCNVSYIESNSVFCLLEKDEKYCKILSTNGEVSWIYLANWCKDDIEEVNQ